MKLIPVHSPDGTFNGWIAPSLIVSVDSNSRYFTYFDGDRLRHGVAPEGVLKEILGLREPA